jgi:hypothetical protein
MLSGTPAAYSMASVEQISSATQPKVAFNVHLVCKGITLILLTQHATT